MIEQFCDWLRATQLSVAFQTWAWFVPTVQVVHIICISIVVMGIIRVSFTLIRVPRDGVQGAGSQAGLISTIWLAMLLLLISGTLLTIAEPARELLNWAFRIKMALIAAIVAALLSVQQVMRRKPNFWSETVSSRAVARLLGLVCLLITAAIITAGRWIAYV